MHKTSGDHSEFARSFFHSPFQQIFVTLRPNGVSRFDNAKRIPHRRLRLGADGPYRRTGNPTHPQQGATAGSFHRPRRIIERYDLLPAHRAWALVCHRLHREQPVGASDYRQCVSRRLCRLSVRPQPVAPAGDTET